LTTSKEIYKIFMATYTTARGTRDFTPKQMRKRNYIFDTIREIFKKYAFQPIETPAIENLQTLTGKYGEEGDKLLFKILNSGNFLDKIDSRILAAGDHKKLSPLIAEKGLRYDLTVPFARFVVEHQHELAFPFKRYQIQPVWRADKPQKGRYREFYQCDADIIGSDSLLNEAELIMMIHEVFSELNIEIVIKINHRKILKGLAELLRVENEFTRLTTILDKMDKIGSKEVMNQLENIENINLKELQRIRNLFIHPDSSRIDEFGLDEILENSKIGQEGNKDLEIIRNYLHKSGFQGNIPTEDISLARGLDYYTGTIIEVVPLDVQIGSICGGGRYDDLTGIFGLNNISGVGISFGADRIYDVMEDLNLFPDESIAGTQLLLINFGDKEEQHCLSLLKQLRDSGIRAELYPDQVKIKKQMTYANRRSIPYVLIAGAEEIHKGEYALKNMKDGIQKTLKISEIIALLR
jgi:histidyl-tRNA synthetase